MQKKTNVHKYIIGLVLILSMVVVSTYAWNADSSLTTDPTKVYVTSSPGTTTTITSYSSKPLGKNQIHVSLTTATASATNGIDFMFLDSSGNIIACNRDVSWNGGAAITVNSDNTYTVAGPITTGTYTIDITRHTGQVDTVLWKDLNNSTIAGMQTFNGLMVVIK